MQDKHLSNPQIVALLKEVLAAMEVKKYNWFKIRAYQNAIAVLDNLTSSIQDVWEEGRLAEIPGIGESLTEHLSDLFSRGIVTEWEYLKKDLPDGMFALLGLRGIGAKKAYKLAKAFHLDNRTTALEKLKIHAEKNEIQALDGFGEKSEHDILDALNEQKMTKNEKPRMLLIKAEEIISRILQHMNKCEDVLKIDACGSFRRRNPTVGDLDIVVATDKPAVVIDYFLTFPEIAEVLVRGDRKASVVLKNDVQADINVSKPQAYGAMVQYNTGSKQHNILLRTYSLEKNMSLSEYGIKQGAKVFEFDNEPAFYKHIGLPYIEPELRQGSDEVDLARKNKLPELVKLEDIRGDLHTHTVFSDGVCTMEEMVAAATKLGYQYYGVSDHAPSIQSRGYKEVERLLLQQRAMVDELNKKQDKMRVFLGTEVNVLVSGEIALPNDLLSIFDYVICGIHTSYDQEKSELTKRLITAVENPYVTFIPHPSGRLINERQACDIDWKKLMDAVVANGKYLEINGQPDRLDLTEDLVRVAVSKGIKLFVDTDSHAPEQLMNMRYALDVARRGFCTKSNIVNALPLEEFVKITKKH